MWLDARALLRRFCPLVLVLTLASCSSTTLLYNRLDFLLPWYVDDYVDLDRMQKEFLDEQLEPFLIWHREEELPLYIQTLERIETALGEPLDEKILLAIQVDFEQAWLRLEARSMEWLLALGAELSEDQIQEFMDALWDQQEEFEEEYLKRDAQAFIEDNYESLTDRLADYLGRLSKAQKAVAMTSVATLQRSDEAWLNERARWLEQLAVVLQREDGWEEKLLAAIAAREENVSSEYLEVTQYNTLVLYSAVAEILNNRSEKQAAVLSEKLSELHEDLLALSSPVED